MQRSIALENNGFFSLLAILIFFLNSAFMGGSLTIVLLFTPLWIYLSQKSKAGLHYGIIFIFFLLLAYIPLHFIDGVAYSMHYFRSFAVLISLLLFINVSIYYIQQEEHQLDGLFRYLLIANFTLALLSIPLLFIPSLKDLVWYSISISENIEVIPRLKLFTPEASHYAFIITPLFIYFMCRWIFFKVNNVFPLIMMAIIPLILSFSLGVLAILFLSFCLLLAIKYKSWLIQIITPIKLLGLILLGISLLYLLYHFFPENPLYVRIQNFMEGKDTSGRGRTYESFIIADYVAALKSKIWGIGPGQLKFIARDSIVQYYHYMKIPDVIRIPNASAETIAWYGYSGLAIRILLQFFLFIKTSVWQNPFRLWLFLFVFIYQFTGSYITNPYEYLLWILVFLPIFKDMNLKSKHV